MAEERSLSLSELKPYAELPPVEDRRSLKRLEAILFDPQSKPDRSFADLWTMRVPGGEFDYSRLSQDPSYRALAEYVASLPGTAARRDARTATQAAAEPTTLDYWIALAKKAAEPITSYPETYDKMQREARERMAKGVQQLGETYDVASLPTKEARRAARRARADNATYGLGNTVLGAAEYLTSPIQAGLRTVVGKPIEDATGIRKEYVEFTAGMLMPGLGLTRLPAKAVPKAASEVASSNKGMYNLEPRPRTVEMDYPKGLPPHDPVTGRPFVDIYGHPIQPTATIVGRRSVLSGEGTPISEAELDALAKIVTGYPPMARSASEMGGDLAKYQKKLGSFLDDITAGKAETPYPPDGYARRILYDTSPDPAVVYHATAHDVGHAIGDRVGNATVTKGTVPFNFPSEAGYVDPLARNFHGMNDPTWRRVKLDTPPKFRSTPETKGYPHKEAPLERSAEALRALLTNPDPFKTAFPKLAEYYADLVRKDPILSRYLTLNSIAAPAAGAATSAAVLGQILDEVRGRQQGSDDGTQAQQRPGR